MNWTSPAEDQAEERKSTYGLEHHGLRHYRKAYWNLPPEALYEEILARSEGRLTNGGAVAVRSGEHTARAASDKFIVQEPTTQDRVSWGEYNIPCSQENFERVHQQLRTYLQGKDLFVQDGFAGASEKTRLPVRIISTWAWHGLFSHNMFIKPQTREAYRNHVPAFTLIAAPECKGLPDANELNSETFILLNFQKKLALIGNTGYGGEIKKTIFTVMNYLMPLEDVLPMHCSANMGPEGDTALFFGLSGTGKTTLSADPSRRLIGDDEHGWDKDGVFNFEDGCFAKVINLSEEAEPQIYACTQKFGTLLENVIYDPVSREVDLDDDQITKNTRASYPLHFIDNAFLDKRGPHPKNMIFLTCDASGVMPPIARLTPNQALYHFISGYTSKVGGTEAGVGDDPEKTFSACFGAPFMVHHLSVYAELLKSKIQDHEVNTWLLNTGWVGGPYGIGERISIHYTRSLLTAALSGDLMDVEYSPDPYFGFLIPNSCPGVPDHILQPASSWKDPRAYDQKYRELAHLFMINYEKYASGMPREVLEAGPDL